MLSHPIGGCKEAWKPLATVSENSLPDRLEDANPKLSVRSGSTDQKPLTHALRAISLLTNTKPFSLAFSSQN